MLQWLYLEETFSSFNGDMLLATDRLDEAQTLAKDKFESKVSLYERKLLNQKDI